MAAERIAIRISSSLKARVNAAVKDEGYGPRGKSEWIREALHTMLDDDPAMNYVGQGDSLEGVHDTNDLITVPPSLKIFLMDKKLQLQIQSPGIEGPMSLLLRSAIRFRLQNPARFITKPALLLPAVKVRRGSGGQSALS